MSRKGMVSRTVVVVVVVVVAVAVVDDDDNGNSTSRINKNDSRGNHLDFFFKEIDL